MIGKTLLLASMALALFTSTKMPFPISYNTAFYGSFSWGSIESARKKNRRNKSNKRWRRYR